MKHFLFLFCFILCLVACNKGPCDHEKCIQNKQKLVTIIDSLELITHAYQEQVMRYQLTGDPSVNPVKENNLNLPEKNCEPYIYIGCRGGKYMLCTSNKTGIVRKYYSPSKKDLEKFPHVNACKKTTK